MCCGKSIRGPQGETGATGAPGGPEVTQVIVGNTAIPAQTDLTIIASAAQTADLVYYGQVQFVSGTGVSSVTVTPLVNGVAQTSKALVSNAIDGGIGTVSLVIPISDLQAITSGQSFALRITMSDYSLVGSIARVRLNYYYQ